MKTRRLLLVSCCLAAIPTAAQTPEVMQRLRADYSYVGPFKDSLAVVCKVEYEGSGLQNSKARYGYVDIRGKVRVPLIYHSADDFLGPAALVGMDDSGIRKFGYIDRAGKALCGFEWKNMNPMSEGIGVAWNGITERSYTLIDSLGNRLDLDYDFCGDCKEGLLPVGRGKWEVDRETMHFIELQYVLHGKKGFIDKNGRVVIPLIFDDVRGFHDGLAPAGNMGKYYIKWGFIDRAGRVVIPFEYYDIEPFSNGRALVAKIDERGQRIFGYVDKKGREVLHEWSEEIPITHFLF